MPSSSAKDNEIITHNDPLRKEKYDKTAKDVAMADFPEENEIKLRGSRYTFSSDFGTIMEVEAAGRMAERYGRDLFVGPDKQLFQSYMCLYACGSNSLRSKLDYDEEQPEWIALKKKVGAGLEKLEADARKKAEKKELENPSWQKEGVDYSIVRKSQLNNSKTIVLNYFKTMDNKWLNHSGTLKKLEAELMSANGKQAPEA